VIENQSSHGVNVFAEPFDLQIGFRYPLLGLYELLFVALFVVLVAGRQQFHAVRQSFESFIEVHVFTLYVALRTLKHYIRRHFNGLRAATYRRAKWHGKTVSNDAEERSRRITRT
jgi:hypothetical protein